jgi:hypothetical protein
MKNPLLLLLGCTLIAPVLQAQPTAQWVRQGAGPLSTYGNGITRDAAGDLYITGEFRDSVTFGTVVLTESSFGSPYYAKYDTSGTLLWAFKDKGGDGILSDGASAQYLWNNENARIQKVRADGSLIWDKAMFTTASFGSVGIMGVYPKGDRLYVTGFYSDNGYFGTDTLINQGGWDIFMAAYDSSGNALWARTAGGAGLDKGYDAFPASTGEVYFAGYFADSAWIDGVPVMGNGNKDIYVVKFSQDGDLSWVRTFGGAGLDLGAAMQEDEAGSLYLTGRFHTSMTMGTVSLSANNLAAFVAKLDTAGNTLWAHAIDGTGDDEEADLHYSNGRLHFISTTAGDVALASLTATGLGGLDMAMGEIDTAGAPLWIKLYGGNANDEGAGLLEYEGSLYFNGSFNSTANFDSHTLVSAASWDVVTGKLNVSGAMSVSSTSSLAIEVYPNPTSETLHFLAETGFQGATLRCIDLAGKCVIEINGFVGTQGEISVGHLPAGIYLFEIEQGDKMLRTKFSKF